MLRFLWTWEKGGFSDSSAFWALFCVAAGLCWKWFNLLVDLLPWPCSWLCSFLQRCWRRFCLASDAHDHILDDRACKHSANEYFPQAMASDFVALLQAGSNLSAAELLRNLQKSQEQGQQHQQGFVCLPHLRYTVSISIYPFLASFFANLVNSVLQCFIAACSKPTSAQQGAQDLAPSLTLWPGDPRKKGENLSTRLVRFQGQDARLLQPIWAAKAARGIGLLNLFSKAPAHLT